MAKSRVTVGGRRPQTGNAAFARFKNDLAKLPVSVAHEAASEAAPLLTRLTRLAFASGKNVYGEPRDWRRPSATGKPITLVQSGYTRDSLRFEATGTIVRCVLGKSYQKYLIGWYGVLPNGYPPTWWDQQLRQLVSDVEQRHTSRLGRRVPGRAA